MILSVEEIGSLNAIYAAFLSLTLLALNSLLNWLRTKKPLAEQKETLESLHSEVQQVKNELKTNGGTSTKDIVIKTQADVCTIFDHLKSLGWGQSTTNVRIETLMNHANSPMFILNENGDYIFANTSMKQLYGMSEFPQRIGLNAAVDVKTRMRIRTDLDKALRNKEPFSDEFEIKNQLTGTNCTIAIDIQPSWDQDKNFIQFSGSAKVIS